MQSTVPNSAKIRPRVIVIEEDSPDKVDVHELNIHPLSVVTGTRLLDFICDYDGELCVNHVVQTMKNNAYNLLPGPFREKAPVEIGYWLSINIHKQPNGKYRILKWYLFTDKPDRKGFEKLTNALVHGQAFQPHWVGSAYTLHVKKVLLYLFERLVGTSVIYLNWAGEGDESDEPAPTTNAPVSSNDAPYDKEKRKQGWAYIRRYRPLANNENQFQEWTDEHINDPESPIYCWNKSEVKEALHNYAKGSSGARTLTKFPVSLKKLHPQVLNKIAVPMLSTHNVHGILWVGKSRVGKSTCSKSSGLAVSGHQIATGHREDLIPSILCANRFDFFRLEPGTIFKPAIGDDINLRKVPPEDLKHASSPREEDALVWARWGGAQFAMNQSRQFTLNPYDKAFEKTLAPKTDHGVEYISFEQFKQLIHMIWPIDSDDEDIEAYFNRLHVVVLTDKFIYYRFATQGQRDVARMPYPDPERPDLFVPEAAEILHRFKTDQTYAPDDYADDFAWDVSLLNNLARGYSIPGSITVTGPLLFSGNRSVTTYRHPSFSLSLSDEDAHDPQASSIVPFKGEPVIQQSSGVSSSIADPAGLSHDMIGSVASGFCGSPADAQELQMILRSITEASGIDGQTIDLLSPSPIKRTESICGTLEDEVERQSILSTRASRLMATLEGQTVSISDDDTVATPPRKKQFVDTRSVGACSSHPSSSSANPNPSVVNTYSSQCPTNPNPTASGTGGPVAEQAETYEWSGDDENVFNHNTSLDEE